MPFEIKPIDQYSSVEFKKARSLIKEMIEEKKKSAEHIYQNIMPVKILQLEELFQSTADICKNAKEIRTVSDSHQHHNIEDLNAIRAVSLSTIGPVPDLAADSKKRKLDAKGADCPVEGCQKIHLHDYSAYPHVKAVPVIEKLLSILKMEALQLLEYVRTIKLWIQLSIPKIEDGNNFGVSIQEETLADFAKAEESCAVILGLATVYHTSRSQILCKIYKFPNIENYKKALQEIDEKEYITTRVMIQDLVGCYLTFYDSLEKNIEKLRNPRSQNNSNLY